MAALLPSPRQATRRARYHVRVRGGCDIPSHRPNHHHGLVRQRTCLGARISLPAAEIDALIIRECRLHLSTPGRHGYAQAFPVWRNAQASR